MVDLHRGIEALPIIDEFIQRASDKHLDPELWVEVMDHRLRHFEGTKDGAGCRQTATMWEQLKRPEPNSLYSAACFRSVTAAVIRASDQSPAGRKQAAEEADKAMSWLKQAVAAGYKDVARLEKDKDLRALQDREDFKKLLAGLKADAGAKK